MKKFDRKVVLITGAASGIGRDLAERFTSEGATVALVDKNSDALEKLSSSLQGSHAFCADLSIREQTRGIVHEVVDRCGKIDILVNNAATCADDPFETLSDDDWAQDLTVDLTAPFQLSQDALPTLQENRGVILNVASVNGLLYYGNESYSAAKAGLISLTRSLAVRFGPYGIRVNALAPGTIKTPIWDERIKADPQVLDLAKRWYPLDRLGEVEDVSNAALFLCSTDASWITGTTLTVDGGLTAGNGIMMKEIVPEQ